MVDSSRKPFGKSAALAALVATAPLASQVENRRVLVRVSAAPQPERRELTDEERGQLKLDRKERRAKRMKLRRHRGFR